jgi:hypothetical protein
MEFKDAWFCGDEQTTSADGQCVYKSLIACGFGLVTVAALDTHLPTALAARKKTGAVNKYGEQWIEAHVGRPGKAWSLDVVLFTLKKLYGEGSFYWSVKELDYITSREAVGQLFYVAGCLDHNKWNGDDDEEDSGHRAAWHHAICVDRKRNVIIDSNLPTPVRFAVKKLKTVLKDWFLEIWAVRLCNA